METPKYLKGSAFGKLLNVIKNDICKVLWDFTIQTDHIIEARRSDLILIKKEDNNCIIVAFAIHMIPG